MLSTHRSTGFHATVRGSRLGPETRVSRNKPDEFGDWIDQHCPETSAEVVSMVEFDELCGDVRIACTYGMLLCLSRPLRLAYLLGSRQPPSGSLFAARRCKHPGRDPRSNATVVRRPHPGVDTAIDQGVIVTGRDELDLAEAIAAPIRSGWEPERIISTIAASLPTLLQT